jgi:hypothetical protein
VRGRVSARTVLRFTLVVAGLFAAIAISAPETARAQGLFDVLRGIFGGGRPPPQRAAPPMLLEDFPRGGGPDDIRIPGDAGGPRAHYCVRLCDGRYFPIPTGSGSQSPQQLCSAMCPATKTDIYSGSGIERAASSSGKPYSALPNAFVYRDRLVSNCTCTGKDPTGVAQIDVQSDPTLRPGDIVVTEDGPVVFKGDRRGSRKSSDFVPVNEDKRLSSQLRQELSRMRVAEPIGPANVKSEVPAAPVAAANTKSSPATAGTVKVPAPTVNTNASPATTGTVNAPAMTAGAKTSTASASSPASESGTALGFMPESLWTMRGFNPQN